jgi:hypothetical protein
VAERFNVAQRLAEAASAVEHTQSYVWACHVLGYQHPDLTAYASQVRDRYDTEDGLDLFVLDDDCAKLRAAASAADEALSRQRAQHAELAEAWTGPGADAATDFLERHCRAGETVAANVAVAAERCAALRDDLWQLIDAKAATAVAIDDRRLAERSAWLAAAQTVLTGAGDRSPADELVDQQIKPYVDNDVRTDWLGAMRSTAASADASLDAASDAVTAAPVPRFEVPGDLAARSPLLDEPPPPAVDQIPIPVIPAGAGALPTAPSSAGADTEVPAAPPAAACDVPPPLPTDDPQASAVGDPGGLGGLDGLGGASGATGLGGLGSSIGGIISQIVDAVGGLLGSMGDGLDEPSLTDDELGIDDPDDQLDLEDEPETDPGLDTEPAEPQPEPGEPAAPTTPENPPAPAAQVEEPASPPADSAPPPAADPERPTAEPPPPPPADPEPDESTPCEIAADELPQAGQ